jgi:hypothetical protein
MSTQVYGEVSWESDLGFDKKNTNSKDLFLRLDEGTNEVRLITQPFQYLVHKIKKDPENPKDYGSKVQCSAIHGSCPCCATGDKAKPRWLLGVISRKDQTYKILDISYAVFSQIRKYAKNVQRFGDPTKYDINIEVDKNGGATGYYSVQALNKDPLTAADQAIKDSVNMDDLKRRVTPPTPADVQKRIDKIMGTTLGATPAPKPTVSMTDDSDEAATEFPAYDAS